MGYFDRSWNTKLTVDASDKGLSGVLTQSNPADQDDRKIITCISRTLSKAESNYSQIELEALATVWAMDRLRIYLLGKKFKLRVDNKAVSLIYNNPLAIPPTRLKRWELRLTPFDFEVEHIPGKGNIADFLSRHPTEALKNEYDDSEEYINTILSPEHISKNEILQEINKDPLLQNLRQMIRNHRFNKKLLELKSFEKVFNQLSCTSEGLILKEEKLVIPSKFQDKIIQIAHEGHQGMVKTKQLLRSYVWFPGIKKKTETFINSCLACQAVNDSSTPKTPLILSKMPEAPWTEVSIDFFGPLHPSNEYLMVLIDDYSRFPIIENVYSTKCSTIVRHLDSLLGVFGIPEILRGDNGPPFNSEDFRRYEKFMGFKHRKITPEYPQANGIAESFMKNLGKVIQTAKIENIHWSQRLK